MPFATEAEQIRKFENDEVAQHYFEVLRTLISKKSIFAQQVGLKEVANYLGEIFTAAGAKVEVDDSNTAPLSLLNFSPRIQMPRPSFFIIIMIRSQLMETNHGAVIPSPYRSIMELCMAEGSMMIKVTLRPASQLCENTFVKEETYQSISRLS